MNIQHSVRIMYPAIIISINGSTLPSVCYTVIYMVRVGLDWVRAGINTIYHTDGNVLSLMACL